jgi:Zn-dependent peptidase ImmA (M78 family)
VKHTDDPFEQLARVFKVSPIVAGRRALDLKLVGREEFFSFYQDYQQRERQQARAKGGGDFYKTQNVRLGQTFALSVMRAALEGRLSFKEAYDLTGLNGGTFQRYARRLGVPLP